MTTVLGAGLLGIEPHEDCWTEVLQFTVHLPEVHGTCFIKILNRPARNACRFSVWFWDDTETLQANFPYVYDADVPSGSPPDVWQMELDDFLEISRDLSGLIRVKFCDLGLLEFDLAFDAIDVQPIHQPSPDFEAITLPTRAVGRIRLPAMDLEVDADAIVRWSKGAVPIATWKGFGASGISSDAWFFVRCLLAPGEKHTFIEGFIERDGVGSTVVKLEREVTQYLDGYPFDITLTMEDAFGRTTVARGEAANNAELYAHPQNIELASLTKWQFDFVSEDSMWGMDWETTAPLHRNRPTSFPVGLATGLLSTDESDVPAKHFSEATENVLAVSRRFFQAVERADADQMLRLWERSQRVMAVHPGLPISRGWSDVAASWVTLLQRPVEVIVSNLSVSIDDDIARLVYDCDLIRPSYPELESAVLVASTTFAFTKGTWLVIAHHASASSVDPSQGQTGYQ